MKTQDIKLYDAGGDLSKQWFLYWREFDDSRGRRVRKRVYEGINQHKTEVARREAARLLKQQILSAPNEETKAGLSVVLEWIEARKHTLRQSTVAAYRSKSKVFFGWLGRRKLEEQSVEEFFDYLMRERRISKGTHNAYRIQLGFLFREALKVGKDLFGRVRRLPKQSKPAVFFSKLHIKHISNELKKSSDLWLGVQFIYYCFIRPGELRLLRISDIDFEGQKILIRAEIAKNKKEQWITIPAAFLPSIKHLEGLQPNLFVLGLDYKPIGKNRLKVEHQEVIKKLGYDTNRYKLYSWKHTGAIMAVQSGINLKQLQMQIRHHSLDELNGYLRQMGVLDLGDLQNRFPSLD